MLRAYGIEVDTIEVFEYHVIVQEVLSGLIYSVPFSAIEDNDSVQEPSDSNAISMKGWSEWQKEKEQRASLRKNKTKKKPCQSLKLVMP